MQTNLGQLYKWYTNMCALVDDDMTKCTEQELKRLLEIAPAFRREQALGYKHLFGQYACLRTWEMLYEMIGDEAFIPWQYNEYGKPMIPNGRQFSISHCKNALAVAIADKDFYLGIDIESIRSPREGLIERTMNADEQALIAAADDPAVAFIWLWTQKEAVLKMHGTGIIDDLHDVLTKDSNPYSLKTIDSLGVERTHSSADIVFCPSRHGELTSIDWVLSICLSRFP